MDCPYRGTFAIDDRIASTLRNGEGGTLGGFTSPCPRQILHCRNDGRPRALKSVSFSSLSVSLPASPYLLDLTVKPIFDAAK